MNFNSLSVYSTTMFRVFDTEFVWRRCLIFSSLFFSFCVLIDDVWDVLEHLVTSDTRYQFLIWKSNWSTENLGENWEVRVILFGVHEKILRWGRWTWRRDGYFLLLWAPLFALSFSQPHSTWVLFPHYARSIHSSQSSHLAFHLITLANFLLKARLCKLHLLFLSHLFLVSLI